MPSEFLALASERIEYVLGLLSIVYSRTGDWLRCPCPIHRGDNPLAFGWNCNSNHWTCFSHDCHVHYRNDIAGLVQGVLGISYKDAMGWLEASVDVAGVIIKPRESEKPERIYPEFCLKKLLKSNYYRSLGFSEETCLHFQHGEAQAKEMRHRVVFPIRNDRGFIVGFSGRWIGKQDRVDGKIVCVTETNQIVPKWRHTQFARGRLLYNFNEAKQHSKDEIIVVESIGNVMRWYDCGFKNVVACLGSSLSTDQAALLISNSKFAIIACDGDSAGRKGALRSLGKLEEFMDCAILEPPEGKDWADLTNMEVNKIYCEFKQKIQNKCVETKNLSRLQV